MCNKSNNALKRKLVSGTNPSWPIYMCFANEFLIKRYHTKNTFHILEKGTLKFFLHCVYVFFIIIIFHPFFKFSGCTVSCLAHLEPRFVLVYFQGNYKDQDLFKQFVKHALYKFGLRQAIRSLVNLQWLELAKIVKINSCQRKFQKSRASAFPVLVSVYNDQLFLRYKF